MEGGGVMGIFRRSKPQPVRRKGSYRGARWRDTGYTEALVLRRETLARKYARDPLAQQLVVAATGPAYTMARRNARTLSAMQLRLYRRSGRPGGVERGRSVGIRQRKSLVNRWGVRDIKIANAVDGAADLIEIENHPALDLIESPNPLYPGTELEEMNFFFKMVVGDAYQHVTQEDSGYHLWPMYPQHTQIQHSKTDIIEKYFFGRDTTDMIELSPDEVFHYRNGLDKNNPLRGQSDIANVLPGIDLISAVAVADLAFAQAGYAPDHVFSVADETTEEQMDALFGEVEEHWMSRVKSRLPFVGRGIQNIWPINTPPKDLRTPEQVEMYLKQIRQALGWTESMSDSNDSTYAGGKIAEGQYGRYIADKLNEDAAQKTQMMADLFGFDPAEYFFAYDDPIAENEGEFEDRQIKLVGGGILTPNEARVALGLEKVADDETADRLVPIGAAADPFGSLFGGIGPRDPDEDEVDGEVVEPRQKIEETALNGAQIAQLVTLAQQVGTGEIPRAAAQATAEAAFPGIPPEKIQNIFGNLIEGQRPSGSDAGGSEDQGTGDQDVEAPPAPQTDDEGEVRSASPSDSILKAAMGGEADRWTDGECCCVTKDDDDYAGNPILNEIARRYLSTLQQAALGIVTDAQREGVEAAAASRAPNFDRMREAAVSDLSEALQPLIEIAMESALGDGDSVPDSAFDLVPERAVRFLDDYVPPLADDIFETTAEISRRAVQAGLESGASVQEVAQAIEGVPAYRAERIARTELSNASHEGLIEGWKEAGIELCEWVTAPGPSQAHAMIAQRPPRAPGEVWVEAGETLAKETFKRDVRKPPARPNCRCGLIAKLGEVQ